MIKQMYRKPAPPERYVQPDTALIHQELKRKGVTLRLLWEEYEEGAWAERVSVRRYPTAQR